MKNVASAKRIKVAAKGSITHRCPHVNEVDHGWIEITWSTDDGQTIELHSLREYLDTFADQAISHEELVNEVHVWTSQHVPDVEVRAGFITAGLEVAVDALPRHVVHPRHS